MLSQLRTRVRPAALQQHLARQARHHISAVAVSQSLRQTNLAPLHSAPSFPAFTLHSACSVRHLSTSSAGASFDLPAQLEQLGSSFANARLDIEDAMESLNTTYYPADVETAQQSVKETLEHFDALQRELTARGQDEEARKLRESWGIRLEQLKAELDQAVQAGGADH